MKQDIDIKQEFIKHFASYFGSKEGILLVKAPGRVNIIGEHTDYNDGFVLPAAIDRYIVMAGQPRDDDLVRVYSLDYREEVSFRLNDISRNQEQPWINYLAGVIKLLQDRGYRIKGMNLIFCGTIPQGAGLSSSAALEMAVAYLVKKLYQLKITSLEIIKLCQLAENKFVGVNCGIMDQYISCLGAEDRALLIDCRSLEYRQVPLPAADIKWVISNTHIYHSLVDSAYNLRRQECKEAVKVFSRLTGEKKEALRDVSIDEFNQYQEKMEETIRGRARHVISENERVLKAVQALEDGDLSSFGRLMKESHQSLKEFYQVSCAELDLMVELADEVNGVYGSRMTGGGFGGCTVSLVKAEQVENFIDFVGSRYLQETGIKPDFYICNVVDGAALD